MLTCTKCHRSFPRADITVVSHVFRTPGKPFRILRSRTVAHLCQSCRADYEGWDSEPYASQRHQGSHGMRRLVGCLGLAAVVLIAGCGGGAETSVTVPPAKALTGANHPPGSDQSNYLSGAKDWDSDPQWGPLDDHGRLVIGYRICEDLKGGKTSRTIVDRLLEGGYAPATVQGAVSGAVVWLCPSEFKKLS